MTARMKDKAHWARFTEEWIAWARSPSHDAFWVYLRALARFVGSGTGNALEVGCGEGRISRELKTLGYRVTATDAVAALVEASRQANSADVYAVADGKDLPFEDGQFDLVMAYNVLMDVEDVPATLKEIRISRGFLGRPQRGRSTLGRRFIAGFPGFFFDLVPEGRPICGDLFSRLKNTTSSHFKRLSGTPHGLLFTRR